MYNLFIFILCVFTCAIFKLCCRYSTCYKDVTKYIKSSVQKWSK